MQTGIRDVFIDNAIHEIAILKQFKVAENIAVKCGIRFIPKNGFSQKFHLHINNKNLLIRQNLKINILYFDEIFKVSTGCLYMPVIVLEFGHTYGGFICVNYLVSVTYLS